MGTYLANGIVLDITIDKEDLERENFGLEEAIKCLKDEVNIDLYDLKEIEDRYIWTIKPEMFGGNFIEFLEEQFRLYGGEEDRSIAQVIEEIKGLKSPEEIMNLPDEKSSPNFQLLDLFSDYIGYRIEVRYRLICYFMDGKILMECYGRILRYFEQMIRLQRDKYPIVDCVKVMISN